MFIEACVMSGCDYFSGFEGIGIKTAFKLLNKYKSFNNI